MKKLSLTVIMSVVSTFVLAFTSFQRIAIDKPVEVEPSRPLALVVVPKIEIKAPKINIVPKNHDAFLNAIGHYESGNDYTRVNRFGYMGRYQFGKSTLKSIGINVSKNNFLNNPDLQEEAMQRLMLANYKTLRFLINKHEGTVVHGILITKSGVLAAAHLGGAGNVKKWFRHGIVFKDANGTKITTYMRVFRGYELDI